MRKNYLFLLFVVLYFGGKATAQDQNVLPCYSTEMTQRLHAMDPQIIQAQKNYYQKQINAALKKIDLSKVARTTQIDESGNQSFWYDVPVVVHIIHDYNNNADYLSDNFIFDALADWNIVYAKQNADTVDVIPTFRGNIPGTNVPYIGNPHIRLHLASIDPDGKPTHGITRHRSYLTYQGSDYAKLDDWSPTSYVNIWSVNNIPASGGFSAAAYAYWPSEVASIPYWDGIICLWDYVDEGGASSIGSGSSYKTINHECGHVMNLEHPWGPTNYPAVACGDDGVDDTPPTMGHDEPGCLYTVSSDQNSTYDSACASNYYKLYTNTEGGDSLINYPDTTNAQNIMDYTYCSKMFTTGQVVRMHDALNSTLAGRNNLWDTANLVATGVLDINNNFINRVDLKPIPDFVATKGNPSGSTYASKLYYFYIPGGNPITFDNESWNDTITNLTWTFSNEATTPTSTLTSSVSNSFTTPGWVTLTMTATGNNTGDTTVTWPRAVFVANTTGTPAQNIFQDFSGADTASWPFFNYYNNEFYWQIANTGMYDNYSLEYVGFDSRISTDPTNPIYPTTGMPNGDVDDFFTIPVDLTSFTAGHCSLNFNYSGASRSSSSLDITDTLEIDYSINKGQTWTYLTILSKGSLDNKGSVNTAYTPSYPSDWALQSIDIPSTAITNYTVFRFQYRPNVGQNGFSSGNNFFMDRLNFSPFPASIGSVNLDNTDMAVVPNPTSGDAYVVLKGADNTLAKIIVSDITGRVVYTTSQQVTGNAAEIEIPRTVISVAGMYIVQAATGAKTYTQKLVVE